MSCILADSYEHIGGLCCLHFRAEPILNKLHNITFQELLKVTVTTRVKQRARVVLAL
jgi:hypothetical protein